MPDRAIVTRKAFPGRGGRIVAAGTPEQLALDPASVTGPYLKEVL